MTTQNIPHPYEDGMAEEWIATRGSSWKAREFLTLAVTNEPDGLVGAVGLHLNPEHHRGELGYWIGLQFWDRGYATEAAATLLDFGLGVQRQYARIRGRFEDIAMYAILKDDARHGTKWRTSICRAT